MNNRSNDFEKKNLIIRVFLRFIKKRVRIEGFIRILNDFLAHIYDTEIPVKFSADISQSAPFGKSVSLMKSNAAFIF